MDIRRELNFRSSIETLELAEVFELFQRTASVLGSSTTKWSRILEKKLHKEEKASETK
jgi:inactivated superfamily I helicase